MSSERTPRSGMTDQILCVDDEPAVLTSVQRALGRRFTLHTAPSGEAALARVETDGPYAVVLSDMRMPGMDGLVLLTKMRQLAPDTTRIMLTGNADQGTAKAAINEGRIFRFLTKPCDTEDLAQALTDGLRQHQLIAAERALLEDTVRGAIRMLVDVLALVNPAAFGRAEQLARCVRHMMARLSLPDTWEVEVAAMLSQLGQITALPDARDEATPAGRETSETELARLAAQFTVTRDLIRHIPRLEPVGEMIARLPTPALLDHEREVVDQPVVAVGAQLLGVAMAFDRSLRRGVTPAKACARLHACPQHDPRIVAALEGYQPEGQATIVTQVHPRRLEVGMVLAQPLRTTTGLLLVQEGQAVSVALLARLETFCRSGQLGDNVRVWVPAGTSPSDRVAPARLDRDRGAPAVANR